MITGGIMISQTFPLARKQPGQTLAAARYLLEELGLTTLHFVDLPDEKELLTIGKVIAANHVTAVYCITRALSEQSLNLSDLDEVRRLQAVELCKHHLRVACLAHATAIDVVSGPRPMGGETERAQALLALQDSLARLARYARTEAPGIELRVEPLDYAFHKRNTLGTTQELVTLCKALAMQGETLAICLDTAHMLLNGEDIPACIDMAAPYLREFHLCNACTDASHPLGGDHHIAPGAPGVLDIADYAGYVAKLKELPQAIQVFAEMLTPEGTAPKKQTRRCLEILCGSGVEGLPNTLDEEASL